MIVTKAQLANIEWDSALSFQETRPGIHHTSSKDIKLSTQFDMPAKVRATELWEIDRVIRRDFQRQCVLCVDSLNLPASALTLDCCDNEFPVVTSRSGRTSLGFGVMIHNAIDAIADEAQRRGNSYVGELSLSIRQENDYTSIQLSDNGIGIRREVLSKLVPQCGVSTKPDIKLNLRLGGRGHGMLSYGYLVGERGGAIEFETWHPESGPSFVRRDYTDKDRWRQQAEVGVKNSPGTTVRWIIPDPGCRESVSPRW